MNKIMMIGVALMVFLTTGCNIVGVLGSKTYHEQTIPAEFPIKDRASEGLLVYVDRASHSNASFEVRS